MQIQPKAIFVFFLSSVPRYHTHSVLFLTLFGWTFTSSSMLESSHHPYDSFQDRYKYLQIKNSFHFISFMSLPPTPLAYSSTCASSLPLFGSWFPSLVSTFKIFLPSLIWSSSIDADPMKLWKTPELSSICLSHPQL